MNFWKIHKQHSYWSIFFFIVLESLFFKLFLLLFPQSLFHWTLGFILIAWMLFMIYLIRDGCLKSYHQGENMSLLILDQSVLFPVSRYPFFDLRKQSKRKWSNVKCDMQRKKLSKYLMHSHKSRMILICSKDYCINLFRNYRIDVLSYWLNVISHVWLQKIFQEHCCCNCKSINWVHACWYQVQAVYNAMRRDDRMKYFL